MRPSGTPILFAACALAVACGLALFALQRAAGRRDRAAWLTFFMQLALTAWVLVPAWLDGPWFALPVVTIALAAARELVHALRSTIGRTCALALLLGCACALLATHARGAHHIYFLYGCVELNDSFAFIVGRSIGRTPVFPKLSPNKTRAGLAAGLLAAAGTGAALALFEPHWSRALCAGIGLLLGIAGTAADLAASAIKRRAGLKDFSRSLPGHGGVLDAYDSFLLVAPLFYALLLLFET